MSIIGNLIFAYDHWVRAKANENELAKDLGGQVSTFSKTAEGKQWVDGLTAQYGELVAIKPLKMLRGLAGYPKQTFWQYVFKRGVPMDLVVTRTHLLFFDPMLKPEAKMTRVGKDQIRWASVNYGDGSQLHVKLGPGNE